MIYDILSYAGLGIMIIGIYFFFRSIKGFLKATLTKDQPYMKILGIHLGTMGLSSLGLGLCFLGLTLGGTPALSLEANLQASLGGFFFLLFIEWLFTSAAILIKKKDLPDDYRPFVRVSAIFSILPIIASFYAMMEGLVPLMAFPLPKGIPFGDPVVTFYALFILSGAVFVYWLCDLQLQKEGYPKGYAENGFYVAFPAGVVGARIWYVLSQWETEFAGRPFWKVFATWEGGLAIMGGALFGTIAGVLFIIYRRKDIKLSHALDIGVPVILIAQGIGRWGNFFNQEVYGAISTADKWMFLPTFIREQMVIDGQMRVPLFLIESIINITGYFVIRYAIGKGLKKFLVNGDLALVYPIWYGMTRVILEPLRDAEYIMNNMVSYYWGWAFVGLGILGIVALHLFDFLKKKYKKGTTKNV